MPHSRWGLLLAVAVLIGFVPPAAAREPAPPGAAGSGSPDRVFLSFTMPNGDLRYTLTIDAPDRFPCEASRVRFRIPETATNPSVEGPGVRGHLCNNRRRVPVTVVADVPQTRGPAGPSAVIARIHYKAKRQRDQPARVTVRLAPPRGPACFSTGRAGTPISCALGTPVG